MRKITLPYIKGREIELFNWMNRELTDTAHDVFFISHEEKQKTLPQLKYYWGVVIEDIADQTGYEPDEIHDRNKRMFGIKRTYFIGEDAVELIKGLSKMGRKRASDFIDASIRHWTENGVTIREPNQIDRETWIKAMMTDVED